MQKRGWRGNFRGLVLPGAEGQPILKITGTPQQKQDGQVEDVQRQQDNNGKHTGQTAGSGPKGGLERTVPKQRQNQQQAAQPGQKYSQGGGVNAAAEADGGVQVGLVVGIALGGGGGGVEQDALYTHHQGQGSAVQRQGQVAKRAFYHHRGLLIGVISIGGIAERRKD